MNVIHVINQGQLIIGNLKDNMIVYMDNLIANGNVILGNPRALVIKVHYITNERGYTLGHPQEAHLIVDTAKLQTAYGFFSTLVTVVCYTPVALLVLYMQIGDIISHVIHTVFKVITNALALVVNLNVLDMMTNGYLYTEAYIIYAVKILIFCIRVGVQYTIYAPFLIVDLFRNTYAFRA